MQKRKNTAAWTFSQRKYEERSSVFAKACVHACVHARVKRPLTSKVFEGFASYIKYILTPFSLRCPFFFFCSHFKKLAVEIRPQYLAQSNLSIHPIASPPPQRLHRDALQHLLQLLQLPRLLRAASAAISVATTASPAAATAATAVSAAVATNSRVRTGVALLLLLLHPTVFGCPISLCSRLLFLLLLVLLLLPFAEGSFPGEFLVVSLDVLQQLLVLLLLLHKLPLLEELEERREGPRRHIVQQQMSRF